MYSPGVSFMCTFCSFVHQGDFCPSRRFPSHVLSGLAVELPCATSAQKRLARVLLALDVDGIGLVKIEQTASNRSANLVAMLTLQDCSSRTLDRKWRQA
jgi:hypothetical protein